MSEIYDQRESKDISNITLFQKEFNSLKNEVSHNKEFFDEKDYYKEIIDRTQKVINELSKLDKGEYRNISNIKFREKEYAKLWDYNTINTIYQYSEMDQYLNMVLQYSKILHNLSQYKDNENIFDGNADNDLLFISDYLKKWKSYKENYNFYKERFDLFVNWSSWQKWEFYEKYLISIWIYNQQCEEELKLESKIINSKNVSSNDVLIKNKRLLIKSMKWEINNSDISEYNKNVWSIWVDKFNKLVEQERRFNRLKEDFNYIYKEIFDSANWLENKNLLKDFDWLLNKIKSPDFSLEKDYTSIIRDQWDYRKYEIWE